MACRARRPFHKLMWSRLWKEGGALGSTLRVPYRATVEPPLSRVRFLLVCQECGTHSSESARGWRAYRADDVEDDADEPGVLTYCPECSEREFGLR